jgi:hypothetical protein
MQLDRAVSTGEVEGEIRLVDGVHETPIHDSVSSSDGSRLAELRNEFGDEIRAVGRLGGAAHSPMYEQS